MTGKETLAVLTAGAVLGGGFGARIQFRTQAEARDRANVTEACIQAYHDKSGGSTQQTSDCMTKGWIGEVVPPLDFAVGTPRSFFDGYASLERSRGNNFDPNGTLIGAFVGTLLFSWLASVDEKRENRRREAEQESETSEDHADKLTSFGLEGQEVPVSYVKTVDVAEGVDCDEYKVVGYDNLDLGIVTVEPHHKTPKQEVLTGTRTLEGFVDGEGTLIVVGPEDEGSQESRYHFYEGMGIRPPIEVNVGDTMQWIAGEGGLKFYEVCEPPYEEGRFLNLPE